MICFRGLVLIVVFRFLCGYAQDPIVNIPQGRVIGIQVYTKSSLIPVDIYYGIPYATAPLGRFRFSAPERHPGWKRSFYAHRLPPQCPQAYDAGHTYYINEDCLFLNIWTPRVRQRAESKNLPIVVILYSETWYSSGVPLPCEELAAEGVVVVLVSYRLHILGFFTLGSAAARGNLALLDQYMALLWIRENINAFGGNPASITLLGHSAGADSILHHMASPRSTGLFKRAIIMSPYQIWKALDEKNEEDPSETVKVSRVMAGAIGCQKNNDDEILGCLRSKSTSDLVQVVSNTSWIKYMQPVCDDFLPESQRYLPNPISVALSATKHPVMQLDLLLGTTDLESINLNDSTFQDLYKRSSVYLKEYASSVIIPQMLDKLSLQQSEAFSVLKQAIMWEYLQVKTNNPGEAIESIFRIKSAAVWGAGGALLAARLARRVSRLYVYRYSQPFGTDLHGQESNFTGAIHGTDLASLLGDAFMLQVARKVPSQQEKKISQHFRHVFINFIKFGSPGLNEEWQQYKAGDAHVHDIYSDDLNTQKQRSATEEIAFWLQYLPNLSKLVNSPEQSMSLVNGESRLRGGLVALCGVSVLLLLLLCVCAVVLRKQQIRRFDIIDVHN